MKDHNVIALKKEEEIDLLQGILKDGAQRMLAVAIEAEVEGFIDQYRSLTTADDKAAIVRNGYLPERTIQTGLGNIAVKVPKVRDR
jgi:putative transposase